ARMIEIRSELQQLQSQYEINRQLMSQLRSINKDDASAAQPSTSNPTLIRIQNLQSELARLEELNGILDENLTSRISYGADPIKEQLRQYEDILRLYTEQKEKLVITAKEDGVVGAVFCREGEMVSAFDSIATLHTKSPSFVQGYIHEQLHSSIGLGQKVLVRSMAKEKDVVQGEVIGIGTRIVEYPIRLRKVPEVLMWGREVTVRIPPNSGFLLGEKVAISFEKADDNETFSLKNMVSGLFTRAEAVPYEPDTEITSSLVNIVYNGEEVLKDAIEASGVLYLDDIQKYCVISDEHSVLFLMNGDGVIEKSVKIEGVDKIDDMESITTDDSGYIYIAASQNPKKKGTLPDARRLFIRVKRTGEKFVLDAKVFLIDLLQEAVKGNSNADLVMLMNIDKEKRLPDIEGIAYKNNNLYVGFKDPLVNKKSAIVKIKDINDVFKTNSIKPENVELACLLPLKNEKLHVTYRISDLCFINDDLYILGRGVSPISGVEMGSLWVLFQKTKIPGMVYEIPDSKPEGIACDKAKKSVLLICDNGDEKPSQFTIIEDILR
ncbi:MAG: hypothetical protein Q4F84_08660, partial [Fibrobacter sp.]|nr:hypothetical protein [Fibrobacter sp.]